MEGKWQEGQSLGGADSRGGGGRDRHGDKREGWQVLVVWPFFLPSSSNAAFPAAAVGGGEFNPVIRNL